MKNENNKPIPRMCDDICGWHRGDYYSTTEEWGKAHNKKLESTVQITIEDVDEFAALAGINSDVIIKAAMGGHFKIKMKI